MRLIVSGPNAVEQAALSGLHVHRAWCVPKREVPNAARKLPFRPAQMGELDGILHHRNHQGIAVEVELEVPGLDGILSQAVEECGTLVIAEQIEDPHNLGAMIRSSMGLGALGVVVAKHRAAGLTDAVVRASAGVALAYPPVQCSGSIAALALDLQRENWNVVGLSLEGQDIRSVAAALDRSRPTALIIGNEDKGMTKLTSERCTHLARIELNPAVESLNASVACAVALALLR